MTDVYRGDVATPAGPGTRHRRMRTGRWIFTAAVTVGSFVCSACTSSHSGHAPSRSNAFSSLPATTESAAAPPPQQTLAAAGSRLPAGAVISEPAALATAVGGRVWAPVGSRLLEVNPASGRVLRTVALGGVAEGLTAVVGTDVVVHTDVATVAVNTRTGMRDRQPPPAGVVDAGHLWSISDDYQTLLEADPRSGRIQARIALGAANTQDWSPLLAAGGGSIWIGRGQNDDVVRVDEHTLKRTVVRGFGNVDSLLVVGFAFGRLWVQQNNNGAGELFMVDPTTDRIMTRTALGDPHSGSQYIGTNISFANGDVWTADSSNTISQVDGRTGRLVHVYPTQFPPQYLLVAYGSAWIGADQHSASPDFERLPVS